MPDLSPSDLVDTRLADRPAGYRPSLAETRPAEPRAVTRQKFIGFVRDEDSAAALHEALDDHLSEDLQIHLVEFGRARDILAEMTTPEIVLIDLSGQEQPVNAIMELAEVVEPGTIVLAIGDIQNLNFYRTIIKGMGVREYLPKPLTRALVEQNFGPITGDVRPVSAGGQRGGRMIAITGARGGVGASTLASNLAWFIGTELHRHTVLLDSDLHCGTSTLNFNLGGNSGLATVLATPERVDQLLIERSTQQAGNRLHVLASLEALNKPVDYKPGSAGHLVQGLRNRYNIVVADISARFCPLSRDLLVLAQQRVIVLDPSMVSIRNLEKLLAVPAGPAQSPRLMTVLNKAGTAGGLSQSYMEQIMGLRFDAVIPDLPRIVPKTSQFGEQAASLRGPFRSAIAALAQRLGVAELAEKAA